ncbi:hypothetical protein V6N13_108454 [Hibiscus sabdariffa]
MKPHRASLHYVERTIIGLDTPIAKGTREFIQRGGSRVRKKKKGDSVTDGKNHSISGQRAEGKVARSSQKKKSSSSFFAVSSPGRSPRARGEKSLTRVPRKEIACVKHSGMLYRRDRFTSLSFAFTFNQNKRELHRYGDAKTPQSPVPRYKGIDPLQELAHLKADKMLDFSKRKRTAQFCFV